MTWSVLHAALIILCLSLQYTGVSGQSQYDAPPVFILPENLDQPDKLVVIGENSQLANTLVCAAKNADFIEWKYKETLRSGYSGIPAPFSQLTEYIKDGVKYRELSDRDSTRRDRHRLNGYYFCWASNSRDHTTISPPIRFILPAMPYDASTNSLTSSSGNLLAPYRLKCIDKGLIIYPSDFSLWNVAKFTWRKRLSKTELGSTSLIPIVEDERITIDPRTGDLFFSHLVTSDNANLNVEYTPEYQCLVSLESSPVSVLASRHQLTVSAVMEAEGYAPQYPINPKESQVKCLEGKQCIVSCLFGGVKDNIPAPKAKFTPPASDVSYDARPDRSYALFDAFSSAEGTWRCNIPQRDPSTTTIAVEVEVMSYPSLPVGQMVDQFVETGSDVLFECQVAHAPDGVDFFINGNKMEPNPASNIKYTQGTKRFTIEGVQKTQSFSVICTASNEAGTLYRSAQLAVYDPPTIGLTPDEGYTLKSNQTSEEGDFKFPFTCQAVLDAKAIDASIYWETNHTDFKGRQITQRQHSDGIQEIEHQYQSTSTSLKSIMTLFIDTTTQQFLPGGHWWCTVQFKLYGSKDFIRKSSEKKPFVLAGEAKKAVVLAKFDDWWLLGVVAAIVFFILLVILIICCMKQNKGEQYYVDEKERKAGHDPEAELDLYGFHDYKRPPTGGYMPINMSDQDPVKRSRESLDMSDKPLDSDRGSMDEYGDIDPGRFNEDGSFIGQYGKSNNMEDL